LGRFQGMQAPSGTWCGGCAGAGTCGLCWRSVCGLLHPGQGSALRMVCSAGLQLLLLACLPSSTTRSQTGGRAAGFRQYAGCCPATRRQPAAGKCTAAAAAVGFRLASAVGVTGQQGDARLDGRRWCPPGWPVVLCGGGGGAPVLLPWVQHACTYCWSLQLQHTLTRSCLWLLVHVASVCGAYVKPPVPCCCTCVQPGAGRRPSLHHGMLVPAAAHQPATTHALLGHGVAA